MIFFLKIGRIARRGSTLEVYCAVGSIHLPSLTSGSWGAYIYLYELGCPAAALGKGRAGLTEQQHNVFAVPETSLPSLFLLLHALGLVYFLFSQLFILQPSHYCCFVIYIPFFRGGAFPALLGGRYGACQWHLASTRAPTPSCRGCWRVP